MKLTLLTVELQSQWTDTSEDTMGIDVECSSRDK